MIWKEEHFWSRRGIVEPIEEGVSSVVRLEQDIE